MCNRGREPLQWEEQQSEPGLVLPVSISCHHHPAQAGMNIHPVRPWGDRICPARESQGPQELCVTLQGISPYHV